MENLKLLLHSREIYSICTLKTVCSEASNNGLAAILLHQLPFGCHSMAEIPPHHSPLSIGHNLIMFSLISSISLLGSSLFFSCFPQQFDASLSSWIKRRSACFRAKLSWELASFFSFSSLSMLKASG